MMVIMNLVRFPKMYDGAFINTSIAPALTE